ncbi:O-antigen ligase family protein [bacterium]|nr:O-antigen ligase family protein [bacterium]
MKLKLNITLLYLVSGLFIAAGIVAAAYDFWYLFALPLVVPFVYAYIYKPELLIYLVAFATPLSVQLSGSGQSISLSIPTEPIIILLLIGLLFKLVISKKIRWEVFTNALAIIIAVDLLWILVTSFTSTMPLISLKYFISKVWYVAIFYFLLSHLFKSERIIKTFLWCLVLATCVLATYTLYKHSLGSFSRSYAYTAMRPFLPDHGMYAAAVSFVVPVAFVFAIYGKQFKYNSLVRIFALGIFIFLCLAVALSFTRASWVSLVVAFGVYAALLLKIKLKYLLGLGVIVASVLVLNFDQIFTDLSRNKSESDDNIEEHLQSVSNVSTDPSNMERLNRWSCALRMFDDKPIMGFGPGTYTFQYGVYQLPHEMTIISTNAGTLGNVHSEYLRPLVESGVLGFLFFLAIVVTTLFMGFHQYRQLEGSRKYLSLAVFLGLITYFTHGLLNNYSEFDKIAVPLYGFLAVMTANQYYLKQRNKEEVSQPD